MIPQHLEARQQLEAAIATDRVRRPGLRYPGSRQCSNSVNETSATVRTCTWAGAAGARCEGAPTWCVIGGELQSHTRREHTISLDAVIKYTAQYVWQKVHMIVLDTENGHSPGVTTARNRGHRRFGKTQI